MAGRQKRHAKHGRDHFRTTVRQRQRRCHCTDAEPTDRGGQKAAMLADTVATRDDAEEQSEGQTDFVNQRTAQQTANGRQRAEQQGCHEAVHQAQPRQRHRDAVHYSVFDDASGQVRFLSLSL